MRGYCKKMVAKYAGHCGVCDKPIEPGQTILFFGRGRAQHHNCQSSAVQADGCTACSGRGYHWPNTPCRCCDGTGSRTIQDFAKLTPEQRHPAPSQVDPMGVDLAYEDSCARACGL